MVEIREYDASRYLDNDETIAEYLRLSLEDENPDAFLTALGEVVKARGITQLAKDTGLRRESLYKTFGPGKKPQFETVAKIAQALGVPLTVKVGD